jgi:hypothetical protein
VVSKADAERLDPGEVTSNADVVAADEVGVNVEIGIRDDAKVLVLPTVEVEVVSVAAGEARVAAGDTGIEVTDLTSNSIVALVVDRRRKFSL